MMARRKLRRRLAGGAPAAASGSRRCPAAVVQGVSRSEAIQCLERNSMAGVWRAKLQQLCIN
jgi:hypothetical protein